MNTLNSKLFNLNSYSRDRNLNGGCGIPLRGTRTCKQVTVITSDNTNTLNSKLFNLNSYSRDRNLNGGCGITVITSGCGPGNEGSTPSFRFKTERRKRNSGVFNSAIRTPWNVALNQGLNFDLLANSRRCSPSATNVRKINRCIK